MEKLKKEQYKKAMIETSKDKFYLEDMKKIKSKFKYSDFENIVGGSTRIRTWDHSVMSRVL